jgi:hypothetical protein
MHSRSKKSRRGHRRKSPRRRSIRGPKGGAWTDWVPTIGFSNQEPEAIKRRQAYNPFAGREMANIERALKEYKNTVCTKSLDAAEKEMAGFTRVLTDSQKTILGRITAQTMNFKPCANDLPYDFDQEMITGTRSYSRIPVAPVIESAISGTATGSGHVRAAAVASPRRSRPVAEEEGEEQFAS